MKKKFIILLILLSFGLTSCTTIYNYFNPTSAVKTSKTSKGTPSETIPGETPKSSSSSDKTSSTSSPTTSEPVVSGTSTHDHEFDSRWSYDEEYHYHNATCGHDVKNGVERHDFTTSVSGNTITYTCRICGATFTKEASISLDELYGYNYFKEHNENYASLYEDMYAACTAFNSVNTDVENKTEVSGKDCYYFALVDYDEFGLTSADATSVWEIFYIENPQFYYLDSQILYTSEALYLTISEDYITHERRDSINSSLNTLFTNVSEVLKNASTTLEKIYLLHDYILFHMEYAYESDGVTPEDAAWAHNIVGFIENHKGVCESYSKTFIYLSRLFDIDTIAVTGSSRSQEHMWNMSKIDDMWYEFDFTWDDNGTSDYGFEYFGLTREEFSLDHTPNTQTLGINYLYLLPLTSAKALNPVKLYSDKTYLGFYKSINDALSNTEATKDYEIQLLNYFARSSLIDEREYELSNITTDYNSLKILGFKNISTINTDGTVSYYNPNTLKLSSNVVIKNDTVIENVILESESYNLKIKDSTLTLKEYVNAKAPITNDNGTIICDSSFNKISFNNSLSITNLENKQGQNTIGANANITNLILSYSSSYKAPIISFNKDNTTINITNIIFKNVVSSVSQTTLLVSGNAKNCVLSIDNITKDTTSSFNQFTFNIFVADLNNYPDVRINNNTETTINYLVILNDDSSLTKDSFVGEKIIKTTASNKYKLNLSFYKNRAQESINTAKLSLDSDGYLVLMA